MVLQIARGPLSGEASAGWWTGGRTAPLVGPTSRPATELLRTCPLVAGVVRAGAGGHSQEMDRYKITMPNGSVTEKMFESDKDAIICATAANGGMSADVVVERYTDGGELIPTALSRVHDVS